MSIEIQSAEVKNNIPHTFTFTKPVKQYMVGFSKCYMKFSKADHHIKEISIDLTNSEIKNNQITIQPQLKMNDSSDHKESHESSITIVVIATLKHDNSKIYIHTSIKAEESTNLPMINVQPTFIKSALSYSYVKYPKSDHHIYSYITEIAPVVDSNFFVLKGQSILQDQNYHFGNGKVSGGVIVYYGKDQKVLCSDFNSKQIQPNDNGKTDNTQTICFGEAPKDFNSDDYEIGCFIDRYQLSFQDSSDHHVKMIEISAMLSENKLFLENGKICAKMCFKSLLSDGEQHKFDVPHNNVAGFVIAFNKKLSE